MSSWKKVIVSGSDAHLKTVTASFYTGSFVGDGSGITSVSSASYSVSSSYALTASYVHGGAGVPAGTVSSSAQTISHLNGSSILSGSLVPSASYALTASYVNTSAAVSSGVSITLYNGGSDLNTGMQNVPVRIPYNGQVTDWYVQAYDNSNNMINTSIVVDIVSDSFANLPLSGTDSISGTEKPTLVNQSSSFSSSLSTWDNLVQGNFIQAEIESVSAGVKMVLVSLAVDRT